MKSKSVNNPKVSIITVTYNSEDTIDDCLNSIVSQTYSNIEHIVIDGLSNDKTLEIVKRYGISKLISEKDDGIYHAMNKGIYLSTGDLICFLNSDDLYNNDNVIDDIVKFFVNNKCDGIYADLYYVKRFDINKIVRYWKSKKYNSFSTGWHPAHPTLFLTREVYSFFGYFNIDYKLAADFDFMLRVFENKSNFNFKYFEKTIIKMRLGGATSKNLRNIFKQNFEILKSFKQNNIKINPISYLFKRMKIKIGQYEKEL